jgi:DNA processing protein
MSDLKYWLAFNRIPGVGTARFRQLEKHFGLLENAWHADATELDKAGLDRRAVTNVIKLRLDISPDNEMERVEQAGIAAYNWHDTQYPPRLKEIYDPPPVLYVRGSLMPEDERSLAVVGTRKATVYGREATAALAGDLARNKVTIVSGLARGIDSVAHRAALDAEGRTIAVLASGLDIIYPREHKSLADEIAQKGALVSEYPLGVRPDATNFPRRNRIMSGMTLGTLVVEAGETSGALWTVNHALEQNREVFCVPGSVFSPASFGTNRLIQQGAKLVMSYNDVLQELNLSATAHQIQLPISVQPADEGEARLLARLSQEPVHIDDLARETGLPSAEVSSTLVMMELKGLVKQVGGMNYIRVREALSAYGA